MSGRLEPGALFAGRYRVIRLVAEGGMGAIYEVLHCDTDRRRALKIMHSHLFHNDDLRARFLQEARVTAKIRSDHIIDVFDAGLDDTTRTPFMVMELLEGEDLGRLSQRVGALHVPDVVTYLRQTALALTKMHAAAIVHRDLKPENLFLTHTDDGSPRVKLLDFGIAKIIAEGGSGRGTGLVGTPIYMAPEQMCTGAKITSGADIFALGLLAFTLLVGVPYWHRELQRNGGALPFLAIAMQGPITPAVERAAYYGVKLPDAFDAWFSRAVALAPEDRFSSASEAIQALEVIFSLPTALPTAPTALQAPMNDAVQERMAIVDEDEDERSGSKKALPDPKVIAMGSVSGLVFCAENIAFSPSPWSAPVAKEYDTPSTAVRMPQLRLPPNAWMAAQFPELDPHTKRMSDIATLGLIVVFSLFLAIFVLWSGER